MCHALIIDDNMIVNHAIEDRIISMGFRSFDHTWTEHQAVEAVDHRSPDLVVIGNSVACGTPLGVARNLFSHCHAPILMIAADQCCVYRHVRTDSEISGPFHLTEIELAIAVALKSRPGIDPANEVPAPALEFA